jgi:hypothetical protein
MISGIIIFTSLIFTQDPLQAACPPAKEREGLIQPIEFIMESAGRKEEIKNLEEGYAGYFLPICGKG